MKGINIADACAMQISDVARWVSSLDEPSAMAPLLEALGHTLKQLFVKIGLGYLSLDKRPSGTLSGGEAQRTKMIRHLGSSLTDVTYVFDEPHVRAAPIRHPTDERPAAAALCAPVPSRHPQDLSCAIELNRGGDRHSRQRFVAISATRMCWQDHHRIREKRRAEGKTRREIIRWKRHIARQVYRLLTDPPRTPNGASIEAVGPDTVGSRPWRCGGRMPTTSSTSTWTSRSGCW